MGVGVLFIYCLSTYNVVLSRRPQFCVSCLPPSLSSLFTKALVSPGTQSLPQGHPPPLPAPPHLCLHTCPALHGFRESELYWTHTVFYVLSHLPSPRRLIYLFLRFILFLIMCVRVLRICVRVSSGAAEARRGHQTPWSQSYRWLWATQLGAVNPVGLCKSNKCS